MKLVVLLVFSMMFSLSMHVVGSPPVVTRSEWADPAWRLQTVSDLLRTQWSWVDNYESAIRDPNIETLLGSTVSDVLESPFAHSPSHPLTHVIIHHTHSASPSPGLSAAAERAYWRTIVRNIWVEHTLLRHYFDNGPRYGWGDIGYHYFVAPDGTIYQGRDTGLRLSDGILNVNQGAHARGGNRGSLGVAFLGDFGAKKPTAAAMDAAAYLTAWYFQMAGIELVQEIASLEGQQLQRVSGHRNVRVTDCPGDALYSELDAFRTLAQTHLDQDIVRPANVTMLALTLIWLAVMSVAIWQLLSYTGLIR